MTSRLSFYSQELGGSRKSHLATVPNNFEVAMTESQKKSDGKTTLMHIFIYLMNLFVQKLQKFVSNIDFNNKFSVRLLLLLFTLYWINPCSGQGKKIVLMYLYITTKSIISSITGSSLSK